MGIAGLFICLKVVCHKYFCLCNSGEAINRIEEQSIPVIVSKLTSQYLWARKSISQKKGDQQNIPQHLNIDFLCEFSFCQSTALLHRHLILRMEVFRTSSEVITFSSPTL